MNTLIQLFTLIFYAMEQITIKQKLDAIVYDEIHELITLMDKEWFDAGRGATFKVANNVNDAPIINLYTKFNDPVQYYVKEVCASDDGHYLALNGVGEDFRHSEAHYLDGEKANRWAFIPGEIDRLTDTITKILHPEEECYHFNDVQKAAIDKFNEALKELSKAGVFILPHEEDRTFYFATAPRGCFFDSFDNLLSTGEYEKVADIDYHKLPCTDSQYARKPGAVFSVLR